MNLSEDKNKCKNRNVILLILAIVIAIPIIVAYVFLYIDDIQIEKALKTYQPTIEYLKNYTIANNKYPENINDRHINSAKFPYFKYKTFNNKKDFILFVGEYEHSPEPPYIGFYRYCSTPKLDGCNPSYHTKFVEYHQIGDWIDTYYSD